MTKDQYDLIVVGAGIFGISHAFHALRHGLKVALIERNAYPQDATIRNFGQVVPSGFGIKWQAYGRKSLHYYQQIQSEHDISVRPHGSIYLASNTEEMTLLEELAQINKSNDYHSILLTKKQCRKRYKDLRKDYVVGGLYFPDELNVDPLQAAKKIIEYCIQKYDLHYIPNTLIQSIEDHASHAVVSASDLQTFQGSKVIICSGNEFKSLYPEVFRKSNLKIVKLQMQITEPNPTQHLIGSILTGWTIRRYESFRECPSYAEIKSREDSEAFHNQWGIHILFKQTQDGRVVLGDSHEYFGLDDTASSDFHFIHQNVNKFIVKEAKKIFNLATYKIQQYWNGYYCQFDAQDIFDHDITDRIKIITGIGGKGMTAALGFAEEQIENLIN